MVHTRHGPVRYVSQSLIKERDRRKQGTRELYTTEAGKTRHERGSYRCCMNFWAINFKLFKTRHENFIWGRFDMTHLNWKITVLFGTNDQNVGGCYWCWKQIYIFHFYLKYQNCRLSQVVAWCRKSAFSRKIALQPMQSKTWNISRPKSSPHSKHSGIGEPLGGISMTNESPCI